MKVIVLTAMFLLSLLIFTGCSKPTEPAEVAEAFLTELADGDVEDAKAYASPETLKLLEFAAKFGQLPTHDDFVFTLVNETIDGDTATVIYKNAKGQDKPVQLKKIDGQWKVHEKKR